MTEKEIKYIEIHSAACCIGGVVGGVLFGHDVYTRHRKVYSKFECVVNATCASIVGFAVGFAVVVTLPIILPVASVFGIVAIFDNDPPPPPPPPPSIPLLLDNYTVHDRRPT